MTLEDDVLRLRKKLIDKTKRMSDSMYRYYIYDIDSFNSLVEAIGRSDLEITLKNIPKDVLFYNKVSVNVENFEGLADEVIQMFKDMNFYCYLKRGYSKLSMNEKKEILNGFLNDYLPEAHKIYKDLYKRGRVFSAHLGPGNFGESFIMQMSQNYFLCINQDLDNDLFELESYIHELMHIYVHTILESYSTTTFSNTVNGFYLETISLYSELAFYDWMQKNKVCIEAMDFHRNLCDYFTLQYYKTMKYLAVVTEREDVSIVTNNVEYNVLGNNRVLIDDGVPFFQYHEELSQGRLNDYQYGMGMIDAYELLKRERAGEDITKSVKEYLIGLQNVHKFEEELNNGYDLTFMNQEIKNRLDIMKKKYPISNYQVQ